MPPDWDAGLRTLEGRWVCADHPSPAAAVVGCDASEAPFLSPMPFEIIDPDATPKDEEATDAEPDIYLQCRLCAKWRRVPGSTRFPCAWWDCGLNPRPSHRSCHVPEEVLAVTEPDEQESQAAEESAEAEVEHWGADLKARELHEAKERAEAACIEARLNLARAESEEAASAAALQAESDSDVEVHESLVESRAAQGGAAQAGPAQAEVGAASPSDGTAAVQPDAAAKAADGAGVADGGKAAATPPGSPDHPARDAQAAMDPARDAMDPQGVIAPSAPQDPGASLQSAGSQSAGSHPTRSQRAGSRSARFLPTGTPPISVGDDGGGQSSGRRTGALGGDGAGGGRDAARPRVRPPDSIQSCPPPLLPSRDS